MDAFDPISPEWTQQATHAHGFCCPVCQGGPHDALRVWLNRRSPVFTPEYGRKWQEFYECQCGTAWWAWSSDRPPSPFQPADRAEGTAPEEF